MICGWTRFTLNEIIHPVIFQDVKRLSSFLPHSCVTFPKFLTRSFASCSPDRQELYLVRLIWISPYEALSDISYSQWSILQKHPGLKQVHKRWSSCSCGPTTAEIGRSKKIIAFVEIFLRFLSVVLTF